MTVVSFFLDAQWKRKNTGRNYWTTVLPIQHYQSQADKYYKQWDCREHNLKVRVLFILIAC